MLREILIFRLIYFLRHIIRVHPRLDRVVPQRHILIDRQQDRRRRERRKARPVVCHRKQECHQRSQYRRSYIRTDRTDPIYHSALFRKPVRLHRTGAQIETSLPAAYHDTLRQRVHHDIRRTKKQEIEGKPEDNEQRRA